MTAAASTFADQPVRESGRGIRLKDHGGQIKLERGRHGWTGGITADAKHSSGLEFTDETLALADAARQLQEGTESSGQRDILERPYVDEAEAKSSLGHQANLQAAGSAHKKYLGLVTGDQFVSYS